MMKLDFDKLTYENVRFLLALQKPYELRAGFHGLNLRKDCQGCTEDGNNCYDCWVYQFDDKNRLKINKTQKYNNLPNNVLWDIKRGQKKPREWVRIETGMEADRFLRKLTGFY